MAAGQAERLYRESPGSRLPVMILDKSRQPRWCDLWQGNPAIVSPAYRLSGQPYQTLVNSVGCRPYIQYPFTAVRGLRFTDWRARDHVGHLYFTAGELALGEQVRADVGPFVVMEPDVKPLSSPNKRWGIERFAAVVAALPDVTFVRVHGDDCLPFAPVRNIQTRSFRASCAILAASDGYVGTEGGLHHAAAALGKPAVVIFGGFISPRATGYDSPHINIADKGPGSPCGTWLPCRHCQRAMDRITVTRVVNAVRQMRGEIYRPDLDDAVVIHEPGVPLYGHG